MDAHKNFAFSTVAVAPSPGLSGLSLTVQAGDGAKFPAAPFNVVVCPIGVAPLVSNAEIARVTVIAGDVFTLVRQQESGPNRSIIVGDQIFLAATAKTFTDIETALTLLAPLASPALTGVPTVPTAAAGTSTTQAASTAFVTASPIFTGTPTAPTAAAGTATTQLATTAFASAGDKWTVIPLATTGAQNNWNLGLGATNAIVKLSNASLLTISGLAAGYEGQIVIFQGLNSQVDFLHNSGLSSVGNKFSNKVSSGTSSLASTAAGVIAYVYDLANGFWRCLFHDQGAPISAAYAAGNFTSSAGTWTVDPGDLGVYTFYILNNMITVHVTAGTTSVSNAASVLVAQCPGGYQSRNSQFYPGVNRVGDNGTPVLGMTGTTANSANLSNWTNMNGAGFAIAVNNAAVDFSITYEVK